MIWIGYLLSIFDKQHCWPELYFWEVRLEFMKFFATFVTVYATTVNPERQPSLVGSMSRRFSTAIFGANRNNVDHHGLNGDHCHGNAANRMSVIKCIHPIMPYNEF